MGKHLPDHTQRGWLDLSSTGTRCSFREQAGGPWKEGWRWKHSAQPQPSNHVNLVPNWTQTRAFLNVKLGSTTQAKKLFYRNSWNQPANQSLPRHSSSTTENCLKWNQTDNKRQDSEKRWKRKNKLIIKKNLQKQQKRALCELENKWRDHRTKTRHKTIIQNKCAGVDEISRKGKK